MRESGRVVVLVPHGGLDWSGGWSWSRSRSGRATTTTPNCLGAAPSVVAGGRPSPQPQEKTSVALRKQTEGDGKKKKKVEFFLFFSFYLGKNRSISSVSLFLSCFHHTDPRIPVADERACC